MWLRLKRKPSISYLRENYFAKITQPFFFGNILWVSKHYRDKLTNVSFHKKQTKIIWWHLDFGSFSQRFCKNIFQTRANRAAALKNWLYLLFFSFTKTKKIKVISAKFLQKWYFDRIRNLARVHLNDSPIICQNFHLFLKKCITFSVV
jgi:hypothetical protein